MQEQNPDYEQYLHVLDRDTERIITAAKGKIVHPPSLISIDGKPLIQFNSINALQGKAGQHKSRLAANIVAPIIRHHNSGMELGQTLGFEVDHQELERGGLVHTIYADTERDIRVRFPKSAQELFRIAGIPLISLSHFFTPISLLNIPRKFRQQVLMLKVEKLIKEKPHIRPLLIVDVVSDLLSDINSFSAATTFLDWANTMCDEHNMTCLFIIHENPGSDKARGHIGTELLNKATTQIAIRKFMVDGVHLCHEVVFLKTSESELPPPIYVRYDASKGLLTRCDMPDIKQLGGRNTIDTVLIGHLVKRLSNQEEISRQVLCATLAEAMGKAEDTISRKLSYLEKNAVMFNTPSGEMRLEAFKMGKEIIYRLTDSWSEDDVSEDEDIDGF